jgi:hypothetical protein
MGAEKHPTVGSSGEYWSISENLNQHFVEMINSMNWEGYGSCKVCAQIKKMFLYLRRTPGQQRASSCGKTLTGERYWSLLGVKYG